MGTRRFSRRWADDEGPLRWGNEGWILPVRRLLVVRSRRDPVRPRHHSTAWTDLLTLSRYFLGEYALTAMRGSGMVGYPLFGVSVVQGWRGVVGGRRP